MGKFIPVKKEARENQQQGKESSQARVKDRLRVKATTTKNSFLATMFYHELDNDSLRKENTSLKKNNKSLEQQKNALVEKNSLLVKEKAVLEDKLRLKQSQLETQQQIVTALIGHIISWQHSDDIPLFPIALANRHDAIIDSKPQHTDFTQMFNYLHSSDTIDIHKAFKEPSDEVKAVTLSSGFRY